MTDTWKSTYGDSLLLYHRFDPKKQIIVQLLPLFVRKLLMNFKPKLLEGMKLIEDHVLKMVQEVRAGISRLPFSSFLVSKLTEKSWTR